MKRNLPHLLVVAGILLALISLLFDALGAGKGGVQAAQILGAEVGATLALTGIAWKVWRERGGESASLAERARSLPSVFWAALGILPAFLPFLVAPVFFHESLRIRYPEGYIPKIVPIGTDLRALLDSLALWFGRGEFSWAVFAPLTTALFAPLLLLGYPKAYYLIVILTLLGYLASNWLVWLMSAARDRSAVIFIAAISIFSYGAQFELERGQTHTLALTVALLAVYLFHKAPDFRWLAYLLFCVSVQLKFYPALFVVLLTDDWRDWKGALRRFALLGLANFLLFFLLGFSYFSAFLEHMLHGAQDGELNPYNHSVRSFVATLAAPGFYPLGEGARMWIRSRAETLEAAAYLYFLLCFALIALQAYRRNRPGADPDLLLACAIGGITLPSVSHDYTLPLLTAPFAFAFVSWLERTSRWGRAPVVAAAVFAACAYSLTLFPPNYKPPYLGNSFPMIFALLTVAAALSAARTDSLKDSGIETL